MADFLGAMYGQVRKRYRDMSDGTHAEVVAVGTAPIIAVPVIIAKDASESAEVDLGGRALVGVVCPAAIEATTTHISVRHGMVSGTRHVRQVWGTRQQIAISTTLREAVVDPADYPALQFVSIVCETAAGVAVAQATAARDFVLLTRAI